MITLFIILWLLIGLIAVWREYHGMLKMWYNSNKRSYWDFDKDNDKSSAIRVLLYLSPIFIICGLFSLIQFELDDKDNCWWFTTKNK